MRFGRRLEAARKVVSSLCTPRGTAGHIDWVMSIPARPDTDPDLVISATLTDTRDLLGRVEKLEGLLNEVADDSPCRLDHHGFCQAHGFTESPCPVSEARTLLADESKENER
jgi:hypothetical protein